MGLRKRESDTKRVRESEGHNEKDGRTEGDIKRERERVRP